MNRIINNNFACINNKIICFIMIVYNLRSMRMLVPEENSFPGNVMTLIMRKLDLKLENYT